MKKRRVSWFGFVVGIINKVFFGVGGFYLRFVRGFLRKGRFCYRARRLEEESVVLCGFALWMLV